MHEVKAESMIRLRSIDSALISMEPDSTPSYKSDDTG